MKSIIYVLISLLIAPLGAYSANKQEDQTKSLFSKINLEMKGLESVKNFVQQQKYQQASVELLSYYRQRVGVKHPEVNRQDKASHRGQKVSKNEREKALKGLKHQFFVHSGYEYFDYGQDINWQYWPVKDNEVRWQLHRMYWWIPMGKMYWSTGDEKFAKEWIFQFRDWVKDNPRGLSRENDRFAWRQLETSRRVQDLTTLFNYFLDSPHFTPEFLVEFLNSYYQHAERVREKYSAQGNHLLFEAQRMIYGGGFFPEFKNAPIWRQEGIDILNKEIKKQVFKDGYQYELSPNYHVGCINIFLSALQMAQLCNVDSEFPQEYKDIVENMIMANINASYPDYTLPMFGDAKLEGTKKMLKNYKQWAKVFPKNPVIKYYASKRKKGEAPQYLSKPLLDCGFYTFRNGWDMDATVLLMKAGPKGHFHCQPDNGTFELWFKGTNLMPDAGCFVYSGNAKIQEMRNWYRQTRVHQTLTLDNKNIELGARHLFFKTSDNMDVACYENPSYKNLSHRRTVFFVNRQFFVFLDEAKGSATGNVDLHFQIKEGKAFYHPGKNSMVSNYPDKKNILIQSFANSPIKMIKEQVKVSYHYRQELSRPGISFEQMKKDDSTIKYVSVVYPFEGSKAPKVKAQLKKKQIIVSIDGKQYHLNIPLVSNN